MNIPGSRQAVRPEGCMWSWWHLELVSLHDLVRALAAILVWSLLISAVSLCYELWRLQHNWRLGIA